METIDTESLIPHPSVEKPSKPLSSRNGGGCSFLLYVVLLSTASCLVMTFGAVTTYHQMFMTPKHSFGSVQIIDPTLSSSKKIHPPHITPDHGKVQYYILDTPDQGRLYKRVFTIPCDSGMLTFNIGPAATFLPFAFDLYDDAYVFSNNGRLCILYPTYQGFQNGTEPFWNPSDATEYTIPLGHTMHRISTKVNDHPGTKPIDSGIQRRGGDFVIMAKHNFYTPDYFQELKALINSWQKKRGH